MNTLIRKVPPLSIVFFLLMVAGTLKAGAADLATNGSGINENSCSAPDPSGITYRIRVECQREDDPGNAEEVYGELYVEINGQRHDFWIVDRGVARSIDEGTSQEFGVYEMQKEWFEIEQSGQKFYSVISASVGGHLRENDSWPNSDDDLGERSFNMYSNNTFVLTDEVLTFTYEDTIINVYFYFDGSLNVLD